MKSVYQRWDRDDIFRSFDKQGHAKYSPSKFNRFANCPYSAKFERISGTKSKQTEDAALGTAAHEVAAAKLIYGKDSHQAAEKLIQYSDYDVNKLNRDANGYVDFILSQIGDYSIVRVEEMLDMSSWIKDVYGTCDCVIVEPNYLNVIDYKYGMKPVDAVNNEQLIAYAVGAMCAMNFMARPENVNLIIYQPRAMGETVKTWTITYSELIDKAQEIKEKIEKIDKATLSDRNAGPWCEHCGNKICPCKLQYISDMLQVDTAKEYLSDTEIFGLQTVKRNVNRLLQNFENDVLELYEDGDIMQDYDMHYTNGRQTWTDEEQVKKILTENGLGDYLTLPSPAQLRKRTSQEEWDKLQIEPYIYQTKKHKGFVLS